MSEHDIDIADMQCWVFRMAQSKWKKTPEACSKIFQDSDVFGFIASCYDILHFPVNHYYNLCIGHILYRDTVK